MAGVTFKGGKKLKKLLNTALKGGKQTVEVGFFETARYPDGTPVAQVAVTNEFGARNAGRNGKVVIPERPFFRNANKTVQPKLFKLLKFSLDPKRMIVDDRLADKLGTVFQREIQDSITNMNSPSNAPATIELKKSSSPLIDTSLMRNSATYKVKE